MPCWMASSTLVLEVPMISVMLWVWSFM